MHCCAPALGAECGWAQQCWPCPLHRKSAGHCQIGVSAHTCLERARQAPPKPASRACPRTVLLLEPLEPRQHVAPNTRTLARTMLNATQHKLAPTRLARRVRACLQLAAASRCARARTRARAQLQKSDTRILQPRHLLQEVVLLRSSILSSAASSKLASASQQTSPGVEPKVHRHTVRLLHAGAAKITFMTAKCFGRKCAGAYRGQRRCRAAISTAHRHEPKNAKVSLC